MVGGVLSGGGSPGLNDILSLQKAPKDETAAQRDARRWKVAQAFESVLLRQLLKAARAGDTGDPMMASGSSRMVRDMFDDHLADAVAAGDTNGLAGEIHREIERLEVDDTAKALAGGQPLPMGRAPTSPLPMRSGDTSRPLERPGEIPLQHPRRGLPILVPRPEIKVAPGSADN